MSPKVPAQVIVVVTLYASLIFVNVEFKLIVAF